MPDSGPVNDPLLEQESVDPPSAARSARLEYHSLVAFANEASDRLGARYEQIRATSHEDTGTAGDQGEEDWGLVLREWLPAELAIITKGRILGAKGEHSPQVDVLVLRPGYPRALHGIKSYLAGGVLAAFECKTTLRARDLVKATETARRIRELAPGQPGRHTQSCIRRSSTAS